MDANHQFNQFIHGAVASKWGEACIYREKIQHF
jgi:hypothetical protein